MYLLASLKFVNKMNKSFGSLSVPKLGDSSSTYGMNVKAGTANNSTGIQLSNLFNANSTSNNQNSSKNQPSTNPLLSSNYNANTSNLNRLFSSTTSTNPTTNTNTNANPLFSSNTMNPVSQVPSLSANPSNTISSQFNPKPQNSLFPSISLNTSNQPRTSSNQNIDKQQILQLVASYSEQLKPESQGNQFKSFFYNYLNEQDPAKINFLRSYHNYLKNDSTGETNYVDQQDFLRAASENPNPSEKFPVQISSVNQLNSRCKVVKSELLRFTEELRGFNGALGRNHKEYSKLLEIVGLIRAKRNANLRNLLHLVVELEYVSKRTNRCNVDYHRNSVLLGKINHAKELLYSTSRLNARLEELCQYDYERFKVNEENCNYSLTAKEELKEAFARISILRDDIFNKNREMIEEVEYMTSDLARLYKNGKA